jgi:hypothetical protein
MRISISSLLMALVVACGGYSERPEEPAPKPYAPQNNSATLTGVTVGTGTALLSTLRRTVEIKEIEQHPDFEVGPAYVTRRDGGDSLIHSLIRVKNTSSRAYCHVKIEILTWKDAQGNVLGDGLIQFIQGSVGTLTALGSTSANSSCLGPGETGWHLDSKATSGAFDVSVFELKVEAVKDEPGGLDAKLIPTQYTLDNEGKLSVTFKNEGSGSGYMVPDKSFSKYILLDDDNSPLTWGFLTKNLSPIGEVVPGQSGAATAVSGVAFAGTSKKVLVYIDFRMRYE